MYKSKMEIILLRHGKPASIDNHKMSASSFYEWIKSYNATGLCDSSKPTYDTIKIANRCNAIVCSTLPRSIESSKALNINRSSITNAKFNEAGMPSSDWNLLKLSPKLWAVFFRLLWLAGYSKKSESYKQAKTRAAEATNILTDLAKNHGSVLLVGHGIYNRLIAKELTSSGWTGPKNPGTSFWSYSVYNYKNT